MMAVLVFCDLLPEALRFQPSSVGGQRLFMAGVTFWQSQRHGPAKHGACGGMAASVVAAILTIGAVLIAAPVGLAWRRTRRPPDHHCDAGLFQPGAVADAPHPRDLSGGLAAPAAFRIAAARADLCSPRSSSARIARRTGRPALAGRSPMTAISAWGSSFQPHPSPARSRWRPCDARHAADGRKDRGYIAPLDPGAATRSKTPSVPRPRS